MRNDDDPCLKWPLAAYGKVIRGDETTSEDQVAEAFSPELARRLVACWNACSGIPTEELEDTEIIQTLTDMKTLQIQHGELLSLVEELLDKGSFFISAIEANDLHETDFEEWEKRARSAASRTKQK